MRTVLGTLTASRDKLKGERMCNLFVVAAFFAFNFRNSCNKCDKFEGNILCITPVFRDGVSKSRFLPVKLSDTSIKLPYPEVSRKEAAANKTADRPAACPPCAPPKTGMCERSDFDHRNSSIFEALDELGNGAYRSDETHEIIDQVVHHSHPFLLSKV